MNPFSIPIRVGAEKAREEFNHHREIGGRIDHNEAFELGARAMLAELLKTHAVIPRFMPDDAIKAAYLGATVKSEEALRWTRQSFDAVVKAGEAKP